MCGNPHGLCPRLVKAKAVSDLTDLHHKLSSITLCQECGHSLTHSLPTLGQDQNLHLHIVVETVQ